MDAEKILEKVSVHILLKYTLVSIKMVSYAIYGMPNTKSFFRRAIKSLFFITNKVSPFASDELTF